MAASKFKFESDGIAKLLREDQLAVPPNQRSYAWEEQHIKDLLQDLNQSLDNDDNEYFLGTAVLIEAGEETSSIADGQQRLATISIFLARIRDRLFSIDRKNAAQSVDTSFLRSIDMETEEGIARLQLNLEDNEYFRTYVLSGPMDEEFDAAARVTNAKRPSNKRLLRASELVEQFIDDLLKPAKPDQHATILAKWIKFLEHKTTVATVRVSDEIGAYRIFETLNDRGLRASQADILKNYLFSKSGSRLNEAQMMWNNIAGAIEALGGDENDRLVTYLRHFWVTSHGPTKDRELAAQIKSEITGQTKAIQFLNGANSAVQDYVALWSSKHPKWAKYSASTRQSIETMTANLQVQQIRPLMFAVSRFYSTTETDKAFRLFVSWSVRFLIFGGRGGMLDTQYSERARDVGIKRIKAASGLRDAMKSHVPTDKEFEGAFASARVSRAYLARYYLRAIDKTMRGETHPEYVANEEADEINLEHVLPLTPSPEWAVSEDDAKAAQRLLGNMVLLKSDVNVSLGNKKFSEKKKVFKDSNYAVTKDVAKYSKWTLDEIRDRQAKMAKVAVKTWSLKF